MFFYNVLYRYFLLTFVMLLAFSPFQETGLPHTQGTQRIQGNSGNFQVVENLRETQ